MSEVETPKRRWFQFRLRTLLIVVLVLSLSLSWFATRLERARRQREAVEAIQKWSDTVSYEPTGPSAPDWACAILGYDFFIDVVNVSVGPGFGDDEAKYLKGLPKLRALSLSYTEITDAGLKHLDGLTHLESLYLKRTEITGTGLKHLEGLTDLERLNLGHTEITDAGLKHLEGLTDLEVLHLGGTQVTTQGADSLRQALPNCYISLR